MRSSVLAVTVLLTVGWLAVSTDALAVMSVDLGNEFMKVAIVKPGVPMEIAINKESRRKTAVIVSMRNGERLFSDPALASGVRFPDKAYAFFLDLLGKTVDNPAVLKYKERFPYYNIEADPERNTVVFRHDEETTYTPEELLAMILQHAREIAEGFAEQTIADVVVTVPPYYNQAERRAVQHAVELSGLHLLQLMSDNTAVALQYGIFRMKEITNLTQHYMIFDMGTSKTTASIVSFQEVKQKNPATGANEKFPQLTVKGVGYDRSLGGLEFQLRLRNHLARNFNAMKKTSTDVFTNNRAMAKLFKEAGRLKNVLSANAFHFAQIENVMEDIDFKFKVTRDEFIEMCSDLFDRIKTVIDTAYASSEVTQGEITEVLLMGAGTRIPEVQERIMKASGKTELGKSLNTDEAAAIGAVYQAAAASKGFKVKKFAVRDATIFPVQVEFDRVKSDDNGEESVKTVKRTLFGRNNPYPQKKVMTFNKHTKDFNFVVNYELEKLAMEEQEGKIFGSPEISNVALAGVESAFQAHVTDNAEAKGVKAHFRMDESGILLVDKVEAIFERPPEVEKKEGEEGEESTLSKLGSTISNFFGSGDKDAAQEGDVKEDQPGEEAASEDKKTDEKADEKKEEKKEEEKAEEKEEEKTGEKKEEKTEEKKEEKQEEKKEEKKKDQEPEPEKEEKKEEKDEEPKEKEEETKKEGTKEDKDKKKDDKKEEKEEKKEKKPSKPVTVREDITTKVELKDLELPSADAKTQSKQKLRELKKRDQEKLKLEKAQNELESFIINSQDKLYDDLWQKCSTEQEREELTGKLSAASDWLYEVDETTPRKEYEDKLSELTKLMKALTERVKEAEDRPRAMEALNSMVNYSQHFLVSMKNFTGEVAGEQPFTTVEYQTLEKLIVETQEWNTTVQKDQAAVALTDKPVLLVEDIARKIQDLDREVKYLVNKAKTFKPKVKKPAKEDKNKTQTASDNTTKAAAEEEKVVEPAQEEEGVQMDIPPMPGSEEENKDKKKKDEAEEPEETLQLDGEAPSGDAEKSEEQTGEDAKTDDTTTHDGGEL